MFETNPQIQYLFKLLEDDDGSMREILKDAVLDFSLDLILHKSRYLSQISSKNLENFNQFLQEYHYEITRSALQLLMKTCLEDLDLEKAAMILSYWDDPNFPGEELSEQLDDVAFRVKTGLPFAGHPLGFIDHMNKTMFQKLGFKANSTDYYNPDNSFLSKVLTTRKGIPISISLVYLLVAKRIGLPVYGVPMPAHFIVKYDNGEDEIFFDPYARGKIYSRSDCINYLNNANIENHESILGGCSNYEIVLRMLNNIQLVYSSYKDDTDKKQKAEELHGMVEQFFNETFPQA